MTNHVTQGIDKFEFLESPASTACLGNGPLSWLTFLRRRMSSMMVGRLRPKT